MAVRRTLLVVLMPFVVVVATCVAVDDRLYACADTAPRCPDGLVCGDDNLCHLATPVVTADAGADAGADSGFDGGADAATCIPALAPGCSEDTDCCDGLVCTASGCVSPGANCAVDAGITNAFVDGGIGRRFSTRGSTVGATRNGNETCAGAGHAVIYQFVAEGTVRVDLRPLDGGPVPVLAVAADCHAPAFACSPSGTGTLANSLQTPSQPPGQYSVIVESPDGSVGNYEIDIEVTRTLRPAEVCENAAGASLTAGMANDFRRFIREPEPENPCDAGVHDVVYTFNVNQDGGVRLGYTPDAGLDLMFGVTRGEVCRGSVPVTGCINTAGVGGTELIEFAATPGRYYIFLSASQASALGEYRGSLQLP